jgi:hexosaminidase
MSSRSLTISSHRNPSLSFSALSGLMLFIACCATNAAGLNQQQLDQFAANTRLEFALTSNFSDQHQQPQLTLILDNASSISLPKGAGSWAIYFHSIRKISAPDTTGLQLKHIQGDLNMLSPKAEFAGLKAGEQLSFRYESSDPMVSYSDFMPRAFIVGDGLKPAIFANTNTEQLGNFVAAFERPEQQLRHSNDLFPIASSSSRYADNLLLGATAVAPNELAVSIVPTPQNLTQRKGKLTLNSQWQLRYQGGLAQEAQYLKQQLQTLGIALDSQPDNIAASGKFIRLGLGAKLAPESYSASLERDQIILIGGDAAGAFYAIQSLLALIPPNTHAEASLPNVTINDSPRYDWRGMHYDIGRNFHGKAVTLRLIEQMAHYKLNKLHLHLTEDEGWRLEIPGLPELTELGGARCFDPSETRCLMTQLGTGPDKSGSGNG